MQPEPDSSVEERFNAVMQSFGQFLRRAITRLCPKDLGLQFDDIEQDARVRLWKALESEREIENLTSYLYKIAATATIDAVRHALSRNEEQLQLVGSDNEGGKVIALTAEPSKSPESLAEKRELMRKIENAMARLPDNRRRAVGLHLQGLSSREIADVLSWSEPKARNLLYRGLRNLRALLRAEGVEYEE